MSSPKLLTNCNGCVFAKRNQDCQVGCTVGRAEKLGVREVVDGDYQLSRFCNTYRPKEWLDMLDFEEQLNPEEAVLEETYPRMGYFVRLKTDEPKAIDALDLTLKSLVSQSKVPAYVVVVTDKVEYNEEVWGLFIKHFGEDSQTKYHLMQTTDSNVNEIVDDAFGHAQNGWIMCLSSGTYVPEDTLDKLHRLINLEMKQIVLVEPTNGYDNMMFPAFLFKFLNGNKVKLFQDEIVDGRSFLDKVKAADERSEKSCIIKWEEFHAA